ncbi:MAG: TIGR01777 family oxidoreductase [Chitinophagaceae bacterium]
MPTVLITGGTGMIGTALSRHLLSEGYNVIILSRNPRETAVRHNLGTERRIFRSTGNLFYSRWDIDKMTIDATALKEADYVIHLAGAGVADKRWTEARKKEILESRTRSSALLLKCLQQNPNKVKAVISASAIGWYGPDNGKIFTEEDPAANDFLGQTCVAWENSIQPVVELGKRLVKLRLGIVLSDEGGALKEFKKPLALGVAAILGNGKQMTSWIHIDDLCRGFLFAIENRELEGVYNLAAPEPVDNKTLTLTLAQKRNGKAYISLNVPSSFLKLALGEMSVEILKSATVSSLKIHQAGFNFIYPNIKSAIRNLSN